LFAGNLGGSLVQGSVFGFTLCAFYFEVCTSKLSYWVWKRSKSRGV